MERENKKSSSKSKQPHPHNSQPSTAYPQNSNKHVLHQFYCGSFVRVFFFLSFFFWKKKKPHNRIDFTLISHRTVFFKLDFFCCCCFCFIETLCHWVFLAVECDAIMAMKSTGINIWWNLISKHWLNGIDSHIWDIVSTNNWNERQMVVTLGLGHICIRYKKNINNNNIANQLAPTNHLNVSVLSSTVSFFFFLKTEKMKDENEWKKSTKKEQKMKPNYCYVEKNAIIIITRPHFVSDPKWKRDVCAKCKKNIYMKYGKLGNMSEW